MKAEKAAHQSFNDKRKKWDMADKVVQAKLTHRVHHMPLEGFSILIVFLEY